MKAFVVLLLVVALGVVGYLWVFNPYNWFVQCSDRFDPGFLKSIELGDDIDEIIRAYGETTYRARVADTPDFQLHDHYYFCGPAPSWVDRLAIGKSEWYVATDDTGHVVRVGWETRP